MLAMSPICPTLGWEYPLELGTDQAYFDNLDFDSMFLANFSSSQAQGCGDRDNTQESDVQAKQSESPQGTSSTDHFDDNPVLAKKIIHNASERDRRKKINNMYSSLRALLPATDQRKKLSIPATVGRVLEYIPQLQKEAEKLAHKKEVLLSKVAALQGNVDQELIQQDSPLKKFITKETTSLCTVSTNKLGDKEMVIQVSSFERLSISEVILLVEKNGYRVIDVSSFQSFGGMTFYSVHLWTEGSCSVKVERLNEVILSLLVEHKQKQNVNALFLSYMAEDKPDILCTL